MSATDRYNQIMNLVAGDEAAATLSTNLITSGMRYMEKVVEMGHRLTVARQQLSGEQLRAVTEELDKARTTAHEALISALHAFNRYIVKEYEEELEAEGLKGGIFPNPDAIRDRVAIADWAGNLLYGIYDQRKR